MPSKIYLIAAFSLAALMPCCYMSAGAVFSDDISTESNHDATTEDWVLEENSPFDAPDGIDGTVDLPDEPDVHELPSGLVWISIPAGSFDMGCSPGDDDCLPRENPQHLVTVSDFDITETEITQAQYESVTETNWSRFAECGGDCPVESVTWHEAKAFCEAIGGRLPSEAEWEYAARAGTATRYYCGDDAACLDDIAWYGVNAGSKTHAVKGKAANAFGLYDMLGNVCEWVEDCWHADYAGAPSTGEVWAGGDCGLRVWRGGSWSGIGRPLRVSCRFWINPDYGLWYVGFRCARDAP